MRRFMWLIFTPLLLGLGFLGILLFANFFKALSFGYLDPYELEFRIARIVVWGSVALSGLTWLVGKAFQWRKKSSESGVVWREFSNILLAVFFGGCFALAHSWNAWWPYVTVAIPYLAWIFLVEAKREQKTKRRKWWRIFAWAFVPALAFGLINFAAFS